jgi:hypothetical protein
VKSGETVQVSPKTLLAVLLTTIFTYAPAVYGQTAPGTVRVQVSDESGAVLPGVTVVVASGDGKILGTGVTDDTGTCVLTEVPPGPVTVRFSLDGFDTVVRELTVNSGAESLVEERLGLASLQETIVVAGRAPREPRPRPVVNPVPNHDRDSICGPAKPEAAPESLGTIQSIRRQGQLALFTKADEIAIDGGTLNGLEPGLNVVARRYYVIDAARGARVRGEHTSGVLQIVDADEHTARAVVVYACDELMSGDFLASFKPEPVQAPASFGTAVFDGAARILFGDARQLLGAPRRLMVIDQGREDGIRAGQRVTLFRRQRREAKPSIVGDAVVVAVRADSATIRIEDATDAIVPGDWAAPQRPAILRSER